NTTNRAGSSRSPMSPTERCRSTGPNSRQAFRTVWRKSTRPKRIRRSTRSGFPASPPMPGAGWRCPAASFRRTSQPRRQITRVPTSLRSSSAERGARRSFRR
ncbi:hypothetical protein, partial [Mesorhizobium sp.]|uniref:hypothetical protein n=1 Tax=Mesorhizobium sp. TaxID=1871066 RepID=UPI00338EB16F